ncbi:universal stress protein [Zoogloea sp.]|uniref:universal stress protein n=1 Tax=Zoogloea sp. TaxID=49181 RepID=UPI0025F9659B|nr:universal stress protein [Zoogloea sp.]MCK6392770.1 universal stress protein [Zoogloea sp.]
MPTLLMPIDGSEASARVADVLAARLALYRAPAVLHLVNVQHPVGHDVGQFVGHDTLQDYHREEGLKALESVRATLQAVGHSPQLHVLVGEDPAAAIAGLATRLACDEILMTTHGRGALTKLFLGSVASEVVRLADVPVTLLK